MVAELSHACIDEVIESGRLDFVDDLANIVPAVLTMGMLGFPLTDWTIYCEPAHAMVYTPPHSPDFPPCHRAGDRDVRQTRRGNGESADTIPAQAC